MSDEPKPATYVPATLTENVENRVGFVALIDVLGFRELVGRDDQLSQVRYYVDTVASHLEDEKYSQLQFVLFSDNLVINTRDENRESFITLVNACSDIFYNLTRREIAVRGAIAHGLFMRSPNTRQGVIVAGRPIVEADQYQHVQNWVGIMLTPSVLRRDKNLQSECATISRRTSDETVSDWLKRISLSAHIKKWDKIPFHTGESTSDGSYTGFAVVPLNPELSSVKDVVASLNNTLHYLEIMKAAAPNPASQTKYNAALAFLKHVKDEWEMGPNQGLVLLPISPPDTPLENQR